LSDIKKEKRTIHMSDHATFQAIRRNISEEDIERIINSPIETVYDSYEENYKSYGIVEDKYNRNQKLYLLIVHTNLQDHLNYNSVKIITVMYVNRGGLAKWFH
jgi:Domain of unknown function (DUF4258)